MLASLPRYKKAKESLKKFPQTPGVYVFWEGVTPIYIGKAINLRSRLKSYFADELAPKTSQMVSVATEISFTKVTSELEALLLEATLIKKYQPKYNSVAKDDKHPLYICITKEEFPRVITIRKNDPKADPVLSKGKIFGPFPKSTSVTFVLKSLRRVFPFSNHKLGSKACIYNQIGLCNPCPNEISKLGSSERTVETKVYRDNIKKVRGTLEGKFSFVRKDLETQMLLASKREDYALAQELKEKIASFDYITQPITPSAIYNENPNLIEDIRESELIELARLLTLGNINPKLSDKITRLECYDIAHLSGKNPTASMVTFINGEADKNYYRHFKIDEKKGGDDFASISEVAGRRAKHFTDWGKPDLIIVDGGKGQVSAFSSALTKMGVMDIPIIGIAKRYETLVIPTADSGVTQVRLPRGPALNLVQRIRDEAHRFTRRYHHMLVKRTLLHK